VRVLIIILLIIGPINLVFGQTQGQTNVNLTLPSVALLDIESLTSKNFAMSFTAPNEAGNAIITPASNSSIWINFTSAVSASLTRRVTVQASGTLPAGISVTVQANGPLGSGAGTRGTAVGLLTLTTGVQNLITGIGGAYTGNGVSNGFQVTYAASLGTNYSALRSGSAVFTVIYTLTDN
jgi:hypothetical protein